MCDINDKLKQLTNKDCFEKFRKHYNLTKNPEDLFILLCYSFNYQIRFNYYFP